MCHVCSQHNVIGRGTSTRADAGRVTRVRTVLKRDEENRRGRGDRRMKEKHDVKAAATNHAKLLRQCWGKTAARRENLPIALRGCFRHMAAVAAAAAAFSRSVGGWGHESIAQQGGKNPPCNARAAIGGQMRRRGNSARGQQVGASKNAPQRSRTHQHALTTHARTYSLHNQPPLLHPTSVRFASARRNFQALRAAVLRSRNIHLYTSYCCYNHKYYESTGWTQQLDPDRGGPRVRPEMASTLYFVESNKKHECITRSLTIKRCVLVIARLNFFLVWLFLRHQNRPLRLNITNNGGV